jgi:hypothetical protein
MYLEAVDLLEVGADVEMLMKAMFDMNSFNGFPLSFDSHSQSQNPGICNVPKRRAVRKKRCPARASRVQRALKGIISKTGCPCVLS